MVLNIKNCISKLPVKIFIKKKPFEDVRNFFLKNSRRTTASVLKQLSSDITRFFSGHCPIPGANIHVWIKHRPINFD